MMIVMMISKHVELVEDISSLKGVVVTSDVRGAAPARITKDGSSYKVGHGY